MLQRRPPSFINQQCSVDYDLESAVFAREETLREYVSREIVPLMREQLEVAVTREFADVGPNIVRRLGDIVRNLEIPLRQGFERSRDRARDASEDEVRIAPPDPATNDREEAGNIEPSAGPSNQPRDPGSEVPGPIVYYPVENQQNNLVHQGYEPGLTDLDSSWMLDLDGSPGEADWDNILQLGGNSGDDREGQ